MVIGIGYECSDGSIGSCGAGKFGREWLGRPEGLARTMLDADPRASDSLDDFSARPFSVIVPVYNEALGLAQRAKALIDGLPKGCEIMFVCNGCTDESEAILRATVGMKAKVLKTEQGKARAIRYGEAHTALLPRFYVDSDVAISGYDLARLDSHLRDGVELVSPKIDFDLAGASWAARQLSTFWRSLPHARSAAFHHVVGVGKRGRTRWQTFPDVIADDLFIEAQMRPSEKRIIDDVIVISCPPKGAWQWIRVRARWQQGVCQLRQLGVELPASQGQRTAILLAMSRPRTMLQASLYIAANVIARAILLFSRNREAEWYRDPTTR